MTPPYSEAPDMCGNTNPQSLKEWRQYASRNSHHPTPKDKGMKSGGGLDDGRVGSDDGKLNRIGAPGHKFISESAGVGSGDGRPEVSKCLPEPD
jgi:hypothetical protein